MRSFEEWWSERFENKLQAPGLDEMKIREVALNAWTASLIEPDFEGWWNRYYRVRFQSCPILSELMIMSIALKAWEKS